MPTMLELINQLKNENQQLTEELTLLKELIQQYQNAPQVAYPSETKTVTKIQPLFFSVQFPIIKKLEKQIEEMEEYIESLLKENSILYERDESKNARIKQLLEECESIQRERDEYEYYANEFGTESESQKKTIQELETQTKELQTKLSIQELI